MCPDYDLCFKCFGLGADLHGKDHTFRSSETEDELKELTKTMELAVVGTTDGNLGTEIEDLRYNLVSNSRESDISSVSDITEA